MSTTKQNILLTFHDHQNRKHMRHYSWTTTNLAVHGAAVDDGESQFNGLHLDVGAERVTLWSSGLVSVHFDFWLSRSAE